MSAGRRAVSLPTFIGIGAQKSATTWVHAVLADHPAVVMPAQKEIDFFSYHFLRGYEWYRGHFAAAAGAVAGEISPSYLCSLEAPPRVHAYDPAMRLIVVLRDPIVRAFSNHVHEIRKGHYRAADLSFEAGLAQNPMYLEQSRYGKHLSRWREWFAPQSMLILFQEEIAAQPAQAVRNLYGFVGVDPGHKTALAGSRMHENIGYRSETVKTGLRAMGRLARRVGLERLVEMGKDAPLLGTIYRRNRRDFRREVPPMHPDIRQRLLDHLADDIRLLSQLLDGRDLPWPAWRAVNPAASGDRLGPQPIAARTAQVL